MRNIPSAAATGRLGGQAALLVSGRSVPAELTRTVGAGSPRQAQHTGDSVGVLRAVIKAWCGRHDEAHGSEWKSRSGSNSTNDVALRRVSAIE